MEPKVSIIIPTYNRIKFLKDSIESVLKQDYNNFELIVVNDGSTDGTDKFLEQYKKNIKVIEQKNSGVSAARNRGIEYSNGKYIALLDSDDYWMPGKLSAQINFFKSNPDARICQTDEIWIRNEKRVNPKKKHKKPEGDIFFKSLELCLVSPSAVMFEKTLMDEIGMFDENMPACEDYDLWLRISYKYLVYLIDKPFIVKRGGHDDQLSRVAGLDKFRIYSLKKILKRQCLSKEQTIATLNIFKKKCKIFADGCLKRGKEKEADYYNKLIGNQVAISNAMQQIIILEYEN